MRILDKAVQTTGSKLISFVPFGQSLGVPCSQFSIIQEVFGRSFLEKIFAVPFLDQLAL